MLPLGPRHWHCCAAKMAVQGRTEKFMLKDLFVILGCDFRGTDKENVTPFWSGK